ncbi:MAG: hypothetical protein AB1631_09555 [Acidobacteriota bacterium]
MRAESADEGKAARIIEGRIYSLFAFDIGYEVSLEKLSHLSASIPVQPLSRKKQTPAFLQYTRPPHILNLGRCEDLSGERGEVQATVFDFGAISIAYKWPMNRGLPLADLPAAVERLAGCDLAADAGERVEALVKEIAPAIARPCPSSITEDYFLFIIEKLDSPLSPEDLLTLHSSELAQVLRLETTPLSSQQQADALSQRISYYDSDLLLIGWNAAILFDQDYEDTASVLELLNVELLEARRIDSDLDRRIEQYAHLARSYREWPLPFRTPYRQAIRDLTELRNESVLLTERVGNALKLIGDLYLARVYSSAAERLCLKEWERMVSRKLDIIDRFYQMMTDRLRTAQNQTLELTIILLIVVEILMGLFAIG